MNINQNTQNTQKVKRPNRTFGFIITRHVNSLKTNCYWNLCIQSIRNFYTNKIVVIDDNSNPVFLKEYYPYKNVIYIKSEFIGRGELLPFYYFYINKYFDNAVIIHDSVFFQQKIRFDKIITTVMPLWHFEHQRIENPINSMRLIKEMKHRDKLNDMLIDRDKYTVLTMNNNMWMGCFGCQCYIEHSFVKYLHEKYNLFSLLTFIKNREDRCCFERIMGILFFLENPMIWESHIFSLLGPIWTYMEWGYTYDKYIIDNSSIYNIYKNKPLIKIWTGR